MKKNIIFYILFTLLILNVYSGINAFIFIFLFFFIFLIFFNSKTNNYLFLPFIFFPFMFLIRVPDPTNLLLISIPDILTLSCILKYFTINFNKPRKNYIIEYILILLACINFIISFIHILDIFAIPQLIRQYFLPIAYCILIFNVSKFDNLFPLKALKLTIISISIVSFISILNYFNLAHVVAKIPDLTATVTFELDQESGITHGRSLFDVILPRINPFLGGAVGSSAGVLASLAIISFSNFRIFNKIYYNIIFGFIILTCAILTISYTILFSIILSILLYFNLNKRKHFLFLPIFLFFIFYLLTKISPADFNAIDYYNDSFVKNVFDAMVNTNLQSLLFGNGPKLVSSSYQTVTKDYSGDIGLFRILVELGIISFLILLFIVYLLIKKYLTITSNGEKLRKFPYIFLALTMLISIHTIIIFTPPFYPIFAVCIAGIYYDK